MISEEQYSYSEVEQAEAVRVGELISHEKFFQAVLQQQLEIWTVAKTEVGFTDAEWQAYAMHETWIRVYELMLGSGNQDHNEQAVYIAIRGWMDYWTDISPDFGSAVGKIADYMTSGSKKQG
jgi:hypothetical protein